MLQSHSLPKESNKMKQWQGAKPIGWAKVTSKCIHTGTWLSSGTRKYQVASGCVAGGEQIHFSYLKQNSEIEFWELNGWIKDVLRRGNALLMSLTDELLSPIYTHWNEGSTAGGRVTLFSFVPLPQLAKCPISVCLVRVIIVLCVSEAVNTFTPWEHWWCWGVILAQGLWRFSNSNNSTSRITD